MKKPKILIITYGGTITMVVDSATKSVRPPNDIREVLDLLPHTEELAELHMDILSDKDSTNVWPHDWTRIALHIVKRYEEFDAFIITHGTNTMAYTASALSLALGQGLTKPVLITGSQLPLTVYGNDARFNFENTVKAAVEAVRENIAEVMISFADVVLRGSRTVKVSESAFHAFDSPAFPPLASITSTGVHFSHEARRYKGAHILPTVRPHFNAGIVSVDLSPGQSPSLFEDLILSGRCKGVILKSHGAGSVPTEGEFSFLPFIQRASHKYHVPVVVATRFLGGNSYKETNDEPAQLAIQMGAIPAGDMTDVMTEVKLMWLLGQGQMEDAHLRSAIMRSSVGEISPFWGWGAIDIVNEAQKQHASEMV